MNGSKIWRDCDLGVSEIVEEEFKQYLVENLHSLKIEDSCDENIKISDSLCVHFRTVSGDDEVDVINRPYSVYEVIINGCIGSSFFIREFEDNYSKTFVYEMQEYSGVALREIIVYVTHNEWERTYEYLDEHVLYLGVN